MAVAGFLHIHWLMAPGLSLFVITNKKKKTKWRL